MKPKLDIIQLLRAVAALLVCFFHMKGILKQGQWGKILFGNGSVGVPLFFMISGFIMYHTTFQKHTDWAFVKSFILKRIIRIVPLYFLMTLLYIFLLGNGHFYFIEYPKFLLSTLFFFPTYANHIGPSYGMPALAVGWSLNYELYFYLVLGFSMLLPKHRWKILSGWLIVSTLVIPLISKGFVMVDLSEWYGYSVAYFSLMTNPVLLFFVVGMGIAAMYNSRFEPPSLFWANVLAVLAVLNFVLSYFQVLQHFPGWYNHLFNCGLLLFALLQRTKMKPYQVPRSLLLIGNSSFSLYLIHPLLLTFLPKVLRQLGVTGSLDGVWYFMGMLLLIVVCAYVSYQLIEQHLSRKLQSWLLPDSK